MKMNIFKNWAVYAILAMAVFTSCNTDAEGEIYNPDKTANCSFASTQMIAELTADDAGLVKVPVYRGNASEAASLQLNVTMDDAAEELFTCTGNVTFNVGESVAYAEVKFASIDDLGATTKYTIELEIPEGSESPSAESKLKLQLQRQLTWENIGTGTYYSELFGESWEQPVEKAKEGNIYRLPDCIYEGYPLVFSLSEDGQSLSGWDIQATGFKYDPYGMVYFKAMGMERDGNVLSFPMYGLVEYNGGMAALFSGFTETIVLP